MRYSKVEGHSNLIRDGATKAILNTNMNEYKNYMTTKKLKDNEIERVKKLENDVNEIKGDLSEIKTLLKGIIGQ
jgi:predicted transcriptional regulator